MIEKIKKKNRSFLNQPKKWLKYIFLSSLGMTFLSIFFLFMTISYKYSILDSQKKLDNLLTQNSILDSKIFELEQERYKKSLKTNFELSKNIVYLKKTENLAMNYQR